ncbi:MAG: hypothetical protein JNL38_00255 [Myxococcales bacterium]|jgi:hypothetical protein|nr:hypothetical protein [Myxococcales bacterium]
MRRPPLDDLAAGVTLDGVSPHRASAARDEILALFAERLRGGRDVA